MTDIARKLHGTADRVRMLELPGLGEREDKHGKDFSDWSDIEGNSSDVLKDHIKGAEVLITPLDEWLVHNYGSTAPTESLSLQTRLPITYETIRRLDNKL